MSENAIGMGLGMLAIVITWAAALAALSGLGLSYLRWARLEQGGSENLFAAVWIGWAIVIGVLQVWHLFWPVGTGVRVLLLAVGFVGFLVNLRGLLAQRRPELRRVLPFAAASALLALWLANHALAPAMEYDVGLYHLSVLRWFSAFPIVPGLGNLHTRLASNSSYFLYMAAMDLGPWAHRAQHVGVYLLLLVLAVQFGWTAFSVLLRRQPMGGAELFRLVLVPSVVNRLFAGIEYGEPDLAVWVLGIVIGDALIRMVLEARPGEHAWLHLLVALTASSAAATVKLSAGALGIAASAIAIAWGVRKAEGRHLTLPGFAARLKIAVLPVLLAGVWMIRGIVVSGYPVFPSALGGIDVDWRMPAKAAHDEVLWIRSWARLEGGDPNVVLRGWDWLRPWSERVAALASFDLVTPLVVAAPCVALAVARRRRWSGPEVWLAAIGMVPAASLGTWFLTAPEPRFAGSAAWLLAAIALVLAAERWGANRWSRVAPAIVVISLAAALVPHLSSEKYIHPGPKAGFYEVPQVGYVDVTLPSGLVYVRPEQGEQCWDGPLLCAPYPPSNLRLRAADDLSSGFSVAP